MLWISGQNRIGRWLELLSSDDVYGNRFATVAEQCARYLKQWLDIAEKVRDYRNPASAFCMLHRLSEARVARRLSGVEEARAFGDHAAARARLGAVDTASGHDRDRYRIPARVRNANEPNRQPPGMIPFT